MATSIVTQSVLSSPLGKTRFTTSCFPSTHVPSLRRSARIQVNCKAENEDINEVKSQLNPPSLNGGHQEKSDPLSNLTPPPSKEVNPNFFSLFSFYGPAPERINGRLAMVGFVAAILVEIFSGQDLFTQIANGGFAWFVRMTILFTVASFVPFTKGIGPGATSDSFWNPDAEVWNGRAAMVGLFALAVTEFAKGGTLL